MGNKSKKILVKADVEEEVEVPEEEYEVESILWHLPKSATTHSKVKHYKIHWVGYPISQATLEPKASIEKSIYAKYWKQVAAKRAPVEVNVQSTKQAEAPKRKVIVEEKLSFSPKESKPKRSKINEAQPKSTSEFLLGQLTKSRAFLQELCDREDLPSNTKTDIK